MDFAGMTHEQRRRITNFTKSVSSLSEVKIGKKKDMRMRFDLVKGNKVVGG
jgi:hypothetical protein